MTWQKREYHTEMSLSADDHGSVLSSITINRYPDGNYDFTIIARDRDKYEFLVETLGSVMFYDRGESYYSERKIKIITQDHALIAFLFSKVLIVQPDIITHIEAMCSFTRIVDLSKAYRDEQLPAWYAHQTSPLSQSQWTSQATTCVYSTYYSPGSRHSRLIRISIHRYGDGSIEFDLFSRGYHGDYESLNRAINGYKVNDPLLMAGNLVKYQYDASISQRSDLANFIHKLMAYQRDFTSTALSCCRDINLELQGPSVDLFSGIDRTTDPIRMPMTEKDDMPRIDLHDFTNETGRTIYRPSQSTENILRNDSEVITEDQNQDNTKKWCNIL